jgi:nuclear receptor interaction protein
MSACSGIDNTVKIFSPDAYVRRNAALAIGVEQADPTNFPSIMYGRRRGGNDATDDNANGLEGAEGEYDGHKRTEKGLKSRQRLHKAYELASQNDARSSRGMDSTFISSSVVQVRSPASAADVSSRRIPLRSRTDYASEDKGEPRRSRY